MNTQIKLGRVFGVEIGLHVSWFVIAYLIVMSVAQNFRVNDPAWPSSTAWTAAVVTAALFFFTLVVHEMAHSLTAKAHGLPVKSITLFALGGVSKIEKESESPRTEFWIGVSGPVASLLIGSGCLLAARALGWRSGSPSAPALAVLGWLGYINLGLGVFNLLPGFPLDGGRVLRALIWWRTRDVARASRLAVSIGHLMAIVLIVLGVLQFFSGAFINGLWLVFIGWFLNEAGAATAQRAAVDSALKDIRVEDLMMRDCPAVAGGMDVEAFVHDHLLRSGRTCFMVEEGGREVGVLTARDVKRANKSEWADTPVRKVMRPLDKLPSVPAGTSAKTALETMAREDLGQLAVTTDGRVAGIVSRGHILELLQSRLELGA
ncbi:MAG TPA: site-2 protease family protein [Elusimicrobiota bacterium]|nr:site-2 protease family protein [Elusimicrobiota bacterium]